MSLCALHGFKKAATNSTSIRYCQFAITRKTSMTYVFENSRQLPFYFKCSSISTVILSRVKWWFQPQSSRARLSSMLAGQLSAIF